VIILSTDQNMNKSSIGIIEEFSVAHKCREEMRLAHICQ